MAPIATLTVRLSAQIAEFQQQFSAATRSTQQFQQGFQQTATKAAAIGSFFGVSAAAGVAKLSGELLKFVEQGSRLSGVERSFENLAASVRQSGDEMRGALREGTRGLVSDLDLMQAANKAILLGLPVTTEEMGDLARTATVLGKAMGQDATKSFDDLITALGRSSPLILDNLGLTVKVGEANEEYARKLGKTVEQLTEAERKTAFYQAAMEAARQKVEALGEQTKTLGEIAQTAWTSVGNVITKAASIANVQIGKILSSGESLKDFLKEIAVTGSPGAALVSLAARDRAVDALKPKGDVVLPNAASQAAAAQMGATKKAADGARKSVDAYAESVRDLARELSGARLRTDVKRLQDAWASLGAEQRKSSDVMERVADKAMDLYREGATLTGELFALTIQTGKFSSELLPVEAGIGNLADQFPDVTAAIKDSADELVDYLALLNSPALKGVIGLDGLNLNDVSTPIGVPQIPEPPKEVMQAWEKWELSLQGIGGILQDIGDQFDNTFGRVAKRVGVAITSMAQMIQGFSQIGKGFVSTLSGIVSGIGAYLQIMQMVEEANRTDPWNRNSFQRFVDEMGGLAGLDEAFRRMGELGEEFKARFRDLIKGGVWRREDMDALIAEFQTAMDDFEKGMERAIEGVNRRAATFASPFQAILEQIDSAEGDEAIAALKNKMAAMAEAGQEEFERLGIFVASTFAAIVKESGDAIGAIQQLGPAFQVLKDGVGEFGLTSTATIDELLKSFDLINDATLGPIFEAIQATGQIFTGLQGAGYMTAELFQTVATDIGASFRDLEAKGGDVAKAMALSQPILQRLWEAQQKYGDVTDETTAALLRQAEEQGLVGEHMKDVNEKILDVLIAIADVFGADIPDALRNMSGAAATAAEDMTDAFGSAAGQIQSDLDRIRAPKITIPVDYDLGNLPDRELRPFNLSGGDGTVYTQSSVSGPESASTTVILEMDGNQVAETVVPLIPGVVKRYGLV